MGPQELSEALKYFLNWTMENMMYPGHVESMLVILEFKNVSLHELPAMKLQSMVKMIQHYFRGRLFRIVAINSHWMLRGMWNLIWTWID